MNILTNTNNKYYNSFNAKKIEPDFTIKSIKEISSSWNANSIPEKIEFSPLETLANELIVKIRKMNRDIRTQKFNLKKYYSAQDKYDYQELLKQRSLEKNKLNRLAKNTPYNAEELKYIVEEKKDYNFFAPKIFRAKTLEELNKIKAIILEYNLFKDIENLLLQIISLREMLLKKTK